MREDFHEARGWMRWRARACAWVVLLCWGVALQAVAGCRGEISDGAHSAPDESSLGRLSFGLAIGEGVEVTDVRYTVTRTGDGFHRFGTIPYADIESATFTAFLMLPAARGYHLLLEADTTAGGTCVGTADFDIEIGRSTLVDVVIRCPASNNLGSVDIGGRVNVCPSLVSVSAYPGEAVVGAVITLEATVSDFDEGPSSLSYAWNSSDGDLGESITPNAVLLCTAPGDVEVSLAVSDGDEACNAQVSFVVSCFDQPAMVVPTVPEPPMEPEPPVEPEPPMAPDDDAGM